MSDSAPRSAAPEAGTAAADERTPLLPGEGAGQDEEVQEGQDTRTRPRRNWISLFVVFILAVVVIAILVIFGVFGSHKMSGSSAICLTPGCIHAASTILYNLSPNYKEIDPCTNFEQYVCEGWSARNDMRSDQGSLSSMSIMSETGLTAVRHILEGSYPETSSHSSFSPQMLSVNLANTDKDNFLELQRAYNACLNETSIAALGVAPLRDILGNVSALFPPSSSSSSKDYSAAVLYLERFGIDTLVSLYVGADDKSPDETIVSLAPVYGIGLPSNDYYKDKDTVAQYQTVISQVLGALLPVAADKSKADKLASNLVAFETRVSALVPDLDQLQDPVENYNPSTLKKTAALVPSLGLDKVIQSLAPSDYTVDRMITAFPTYLGNLSTILEATSDETIQIFFSWKAIQAFAGLIKAPEVDPVIRFSKILRGQDPDAKPERWQTCISHADNVLGWILSRFFVEVKFSAKAKDLGNQIILDIKKQFITRLGQLDWMDDSVKELAIQKVKAIDQKIGYPDSSPNITNPEDLKAYYSGLEITDGYFHNAVAGWQLQRNQSWSALGKPTDRNEWGLTASTVNAYYNPPGNEIVFPAAIMQFMIFGEDLPGYINYGAFGAVAGHELSHAFDNNGRHYGVDGKLTDWWTNSTVDAFTNLTKCFVSEYDNITAVIGGQTYHVIGKQTLGENLADSGGLHATFDSWNERRQSTPDEQLPGLEEFSQEQLFYLAFGNVWCGKYKDASLKSIILTNEHSPSFARIAGATQNSRGFREAFNCPVKEPTCELW